jgi:tetratricopeptide (TPR) repeat protein
VLLRLGQIYEQAGELERACDLYLKAQARAPLDGTAYDGLRRVCTRLGRHADAEEWARRWNDAYAKKPAVGT